MTEFDKNADVMPADMPGYSQVDELENELRIRQLQYEIRSYEQMLNSNDTGETNGRYISDDIVKFIIDKLSPESRGREYMETKFENQFKFYIDIIKRNC